MRRRSLNSRLPSRPGRRAGFTLMEAMVSLIILVIVMTVVLSLLFSMKSFAEKQQAFIAPRQTARRALDYVAQTLEGAGDWNQITGGAAPLTSGHPYALVMFFEWGKKDSTVRRQASFNNLTGAESSADWTNGIFSVNPGKTPLVTSTNFGTMGTDIISVAFPSAQASPAKIPITNWVGAPMGPDDVEIYLDYASGCGVDLADPYNAGNPNNVKDEGTGGNLEAFQKAVGGPWTETASGDKVSSLVIIADAFGSWRLAQLTGLNTTNTNSATISSTCKNKPMLNPTVNMGQVIKATLKKASVDAPVGQGYFAPGGWRSDLLTPSVSTTSPRLFLISGIDFVSFRHQTVLDPTDSTKTRVIGQLQQKSSGVNPTSGLYAPGLFDPIVDGTGASTFTPIVDNVDDFQVAYILRDGTIWNTSNPTYAFNNGGTRVPLQAQTPVSGGVDCTHWPLATTNLDVACVVGLRVNIVGRSLPMSLGSRSLTAGAVTRTGEKRYRTLAVEDHAVGTVDDTVASGVYDRLRLTTTVMLRNRALGF